MSANEFIRVESCGKGKHSRLLACGRRKCLGCGKYEKAVVGNGKWAAGSVNQMPQLWVLNEGCNIVYLGSDSGPKELCRKWKKETIIPYASIYWNI